MKSMTKKMWFLQCLLLIECYLGNALFLVISSPFFDVFFPLCYSWAWLVWWCMYCICCSSYSFSLYFFTVLISLFSLLVENLALAGQYTVCLFIYLFLSLPHLFFGFFFNKKTLIEIFFFSQRQMFCNLS